MSCSGRSSGSFKGLGRGLWRWTENTQSGLASVGLNVKGEEKASEGSVDKVWTVNWLFLYFCIYVPVHASASASASALGHPISPDSMVCSQMPQNHFQGFRPKGLFRLCSITLQHTFPSGTPAMYQQETSIMSSGWISTFLLFTLLFFFSFLSCLVEEPPCSGSPFVPKTTKWSSAV